MRNNSTRQEDLNFTILKFRVQRCGDMWPKKVGKPWREKRWYTLHAGIVSKEFANFVLKDDRPANSRDMNTLETFWIIVDETIYKDPAPKTLDELRQRALFEKCEFRHALGARTFYTRPQHQETTGDESSIGVILTPWIVCRQNCKHKSRNGQENNTNLLKRVNQWPPFSQRIQILGGELRESQKLPTGGGAMKAFYQPFATGLEHGT